MSDVFRTVRPLFAAFAVAVSAALPSVAAPAARFPLTVSRPADGPSQVVRLDLGAKSVGGYAVFDVSAVKGEPVLRVAYANHLDGLGEKGCFSREKSARYLGPTFDIPALPGNINRHELYRICRTGRFVAPLIQGQERWVRLSLDTPGTEVTLSSFEVVNASVFRDETPVGTFACSDKRLDRLWTISEWTCRLASFPDHNAWKCAGGRLLPRKLEAASGEGWYRGVSPCDGTMRVHYEFDANPHFPSGDFEMLTGSRRVKVVQRDTNALHVADAPIRKGEKFGLSVRKESWPVVSKIALHDRSGNEVWACDFSSEGSLSEWEFARTLSYVADGAKRDRLIWSGDMWWAGLNLFYAFDPSDDPYMRGSVEMLAANQTPEGYIHACPYPERATPPASGEYGPFPSDEFAAWFVPVLYDYFLYSGDLATLRKVRPNAEKLMDYLRAHTAADGTFVQRRETSKHACNLRIGDTSDRAYMNILLWKCSIDCAAIAAVCGDEASRRRHEADAAKLAKSIRKRFWDAKSGGFVCSDVRRSFFFEANALALAVRFATEAEARTIAPRLRFVGHGKFQALAARGFAAYGFTDLVVRAIAAHNWFKLLDPEWKGALSVTECMGMHRKGWGDESHPDTAIAGILSSGILGVNPLTAGYRRFEFRPRPCQSVSFARGKVPTPRGVADAAWELKGDTLDAALTVPPGTEAVVVLPPCARVTIDGKDAASPYTLAPGKHVIVAYGLKKDAVDDLSMNATAWTGGAMRLAASSSHEDGGWSIRHLGAPAKKSAAKGWSSKENAHPDMQEWIQIDLGSEKSIEKIELWARDAAGTGFPRSFVVEAKERNGWRRLATFDDVEPPTGGRAFPIDFYTVIGYENASVVRIRATKLGKPAVDEKSVYRFQLRRLKVTAK